MDSAHRQTDLKILAERERTLRLLTHEIAIMRSHQTRGIRHARASGSSWAEIAQALGLSRQGAQKRGAHELLDDGVAGGSAPPE
jgi:hypothetical protein